MPQYAMFTVRVDRVPHLGPRVPLIFITIISAGVGVLEQRKHKQEMGFSMAKAENVK